MFEIVKLTFVTVLLSPTELLATVPDPDKVNVSEPISPVNDKFEDDTAVFPSYTFDPFAPIDFLLIVTL